MAGNSFLDQFFNVTALSFPQRGEVCARLLAIREQRALDTPSPAPHPSLTHCVHTACDHALDHPDPVVCIPLGASTVCDHCVSWVGPSGPEEAGESCPGCSDYGFRRCRYGQPNRRQLDFSEEDGGAAVFNRELQSEGFGPGGVTDPLGPDDLSSDSELESIYSESVYSEDRMD